jgi:hypothetical protein
MNKYILAKNRSVIQLNTDTLKVNVIDSCYNIDYMWSIEEDGVFFVNGKEIEVKAGNIVLLMYRIGDEENGDIIVLDSPQLTYNFERRKKYYEEQKGREKVKDCCCNCECVSQDC